MSTAKEEGQSVLTWSCWHRTGGVNARSRRSCFQGLGGCSRGGSGTEVLLTPD